MSTAILQAEVQRRIDALTHPTAADVLLQNASDTVGLDLDLTNIIAVHNSATAAITGATPANDLTALNSASIVLGITTKPNSGGGGGSPSVIGDLRPMYVNNTDGLHINAAGEHWLETGNVNTNISSYPDAKQSFHSDSGVYSGISFEPDFVHRTVQDMTWDGEFIWVIGSTYDRAYKYDTSGVYTGISFYYGAQESTGTGITWDGTHFWVLGRTLRVYQYDSVGTYTGTSFAISAQGGLDTRALTWDGTYFWVVNNNFDTIDRYTSEWVYDNFSFSVAAEEDFPSTIVWDGDNFWVSGQTNKIFNEYTTEGISTGRSFSVFAEIGSIPLGAFFDGTHFWISSGSTVYVYGGYSPYVGIPTAETDTSTGLPIFVRIK